MALQGLGFIRIHAKILIMATTGEQAHGQGWNSVVERGRACNIGKRLVRKPLYESKQENRYTEAGDQTRKQHDCVYNG